MGEDNMIELLEVLELYCELILARFGLLEAVSDIDPGVAEAVCGVIHAAPRYPPISCKVESASDLCLPSGPSSRNCTCCGKCSSQKLDAILPSTP